MLIGSAWLWIFWSTIIGEQVVGFRDSAYLYYPLFKWIDAQWAAGVIPLWNPLCNFGIPVVHDGSSSVFYPGKIVFFLRWLPFPARYGIYLAMHVPIAASGTYWLARTLKTNQCGATLAAFAYAFSGAVLFQTTNVVYLVSAAWIPFALCCVWLMFREMKVRWAVWTSVFCALMILGGDPQMCYHVGLICCAFACWKLLRTRRRFYQCDTEQRDKGIRWRVGTRSALLVGIVVVSTFSLSAVQVLPSYVWSQQSIRNGATEPGDRHPPRTLFELAEFGELSSPKEILKGFFGPPAGNTHHDHVYQFSQPPWTLSEMIWPNASGRAYPVHQRWVDALPGAERMWTPSLYAGCFVFVLALLSLNPFSRNRKLAWLSRLALFFTIASFGWYGAGWLANEVAPRWMEKQNLGAPVGGLYWCMVVLLPKYFAFRYPAKLMTIATLAICVLAGLSLDRLLRKRTQKRLAIVSGLLVASSVVLIIFRNRLASLGENLPNDLFGPFDVAGCQAGLLGSAWMTILVLVAGCLVARFMSRTRFAAGLLILGLCSVDILIANSWLVPKVEVSRFETQTDWSAFAEKNKDPILNLPPASFPSVWTEESSEDRLGEIVSWQRKTLYPKHHLEHGIQVMGSFYSIEPKSNLRQRSVPPLNGSFVFSNATNDWEIAATDDSQLHRLSGPQSKSLEWVTCNECEILIEAEDENYDLVKKESWTYFLPMQMVPGWTVDAVDSNGNSQTEEFDPESLRLVVDSANSIKVTARFEPKEFYVGAWISGCSWTLWLLMIAFGFWSRRLH